MMFLRNTIRISIFCLLNITLVAQADNKVKYVSDQLQAPIRQSSNESSRIVKMIPAGEKLEVIGETSQHYNVIYGDNAKGWIHKTFVMDEPAAREYVEMTKANFTQLQEKIDALEKEVINKNNTIETSQGNIRRVEQALGVQTDRVAYLEQINKNVVDIDNNNELLTQINMQQELELKHLKAENFTLKENKRSDEWVKGASILFAGVLLGTSILPRLLRYRNERRSWRR